MTMKGEMHIYDENGTNTWMYSIAIQDGEKTTYVFRKVVVNKKIGKKYLFIK